MTPTTTERGVRIDSVQTEVVESGDGSDPRWDESAIASMVRRVLDEELRDRVNSVVDERLAAETDRRRWRHDRGVF